MTYLDDDRDLCRLLSRLRYVELFAGGHGQQAAARAATNRFLTAARAAGWPVGALADVVDLAPAAVSKRVRTFRQRPIGPLELQVAPPPSAPGKPAPGPPLWLTAGQAREYTGVSAGRVYQWRVAGLLPRTRLAPSGRRWLYHRGDLDRLIALRGGGRILAAKTPAAIANPALGATQVLPAPPVRPKQHYRLKRPNNSTLALRAISSMPGRLRTLRRPGTPPPPG